MDGLQPWAQLELRRRDVKSITKAISVAESLVDFHKTDLSKHKGSGWKSNRGAERRDEEINSYCGRKDHGERERNWGEGSSKPSYQHRGSQPQNYINQEDMFKHPPSEPCAICKGGHWTQLCPKKNQGKTLYSVVTKEGKEEEQKKEEPKEMWLGVMQKINTMRPGSPPKPSPSAQTLYFVDVKAYEKTLQALVDTGATDVFLSSEAAKWLKLRIDPSDRWYKPVNADDIPAIGVARGVKIKVGDWTDRLDFEVIPLDDYDMILGMDFFDRAEAIIDLRTKSIIITDRKCPTVVSLRPEVKVSKRISMIRLVEAKQKKPTPTERKPRFQPMEKPKKQWELPTKSQNKMPTQVLFPEMEDLGAAKGKELLKTHAAVKTPTKTQVSKPKKRRSRGHKTRNQRKPTTRGKEAGGQNKVVAIKFDPKRGAPRAALEWVGENDTGRGLRAPDGRPSGREIPQDSLFLGPLGFF
ncbi:3'-5' exonuclease domain-containing protein [Psidium guajava]|nr:3'-5' exonuclease domain-containing protein [Psidium guajava]